MVNFLESMELSLHGSQISLATRDKIQTPPIYYPPVHTHRPASASLNFRNRFGSRNNSNFCANRRPLSADSRFISNNLKGNHSVKFNLENRTSNSSSNLLKLLIDESPMPSKYWTHKQSNKIEHKDKGQGDIMTGGESSTADSGTSCGDSIEEDIVTIKADVNKTSLLMEKNMKINGKLQDLKINHESTPNGTLKQRRPNSLKLSYDFGSNSNLANVTNNNDKHQNKSMLTTTTSTSTSTTKIPSTKSSDVKKSYDLWVNDNITKKRLDLPGRVSFSTNDVFEIDYSDYDDPETESSHTSANLEKLNKSLNNIETEYKSHNGSGGGGGSEVVSTNGSNGINNNKNNKQYVKEHYMESNSDNELDEIDYGQINEYDLKDDKSSKMNQIIEDYKIEIATINHRHHHQQRMIESPSSSAHRTTDIQLNNVKNNKNCDGKIPTDSKLNQSTNPVIKNYLKAKEQDVRDGENYNRIAQKKLNDLSKKSKNLKDTLSMKPKPSSMSLTFSSSVGAGTKTTSKNHHNIQGSATEKMKKPKSPSMVSATYARQDSNLDEFQIEKVVSWMSVNEENFSEFEFNLNTGGNKMSGDKINGVCGGSSSHSSSGGDTCLLMDKNDAIDKREEIDSTYQDIVDIIKEIEHDRKDSEDFKTLKTDVEFKLNTILNSIESDDSPTTEHDDNIMGSNNKLKEIFSYLDKVDLNCDKALIDAKSNVPDRENMELEFALEPDVIEDVPKIADLLILPNHQLARRIVKLSLRANELSNAIQLSKEHVANVRNDRMKGLRLEKLNGQNRLKEQKKHYEDIVGRHQIFIEQLIKDKATLCEKVSQITRRLDSQNQAWEHRLKTEVDRAKETAIAGEKIRREKWVRENTKKIKELTVKGLEIEINKMSINHKQEAEAMKRQHQLDILKAIEETKEKFEKTERTIRDSYAEDREQAIERERKAIKERFEKQMDDERMSFEQQRHRMIHDFESEKDRLYAEMRDKEHNYEVKKEELLNEKMEILEDTKATFKEKLKQRESKHQIEVTKIQEQFEADFKMWKRECETKMKLRETERENTIREQYRMERDREIDAIVAKVDAESIKNQQDYDSKFGRMKEKYEHEIRELENGEKSFKDKYIDARTRLAESDANNQNLKAMVTQFELQLSHSTKLCDKYNQEKDNLKEEARNEIKNELHTITKEHENEIQRIYSRVQQAIQKKDATLEALQKENSALKERSLKLDAIIRQQRKDYCTK